MKRHLFPLVGLAFWLSTLSCEGTRAEQGLWDTEPTGGPIVTFDLFARPLPEVPLPNDVATRPDRMSPTGRRVNASMVAATQLEGDVRVSLDGLDGWGTLAPITVSFEPEDQSLDIGNIVRRHAGDDFNYADDAVYVINIDRDSPDYGLPVALDIGEGVYPLTLRDREDYYDNDPRALTSTLFFETYYEDSNGNGRLDLCEDRNRNGQADPGEDLDGDGVVFSAERDTNGDGVLNPEEDWNGNGRLDCSEDTDYDGNLDVPNLYCGDDDQGNRIPPWECTDVAVDHGNGEVVIPAGDAWLMTFYELESNTLIIRPMIPLDERTEYAVVLTNRLVDDEGRPVGSPFPKVHHPDQTTSLRPLPDILAEHGGLYGGLGIDDVRFAWTFTTQSVTSDMHDIREGLYGRGPLAEIAEEFPPELRVDLIHGCEAGVDCVLPENRHILRARTQGGEAGLIDIVLDLLEDVELTDQIEPEMVDIVARPFDAVDYIVHFRYPSVNFLENDGQTEDIDGDSRLDLIDEDVNGNGVLDEGEDLDNDGHLDFDEDVNGNLILDGEETQFDLNIAEGHFPHDRGEVAAMAIIPRADPERGIAPPYPVAVYSHGYAVMRAEAILFGAHLARYGIATVGFDSVHHGLGVEAVLEELIGGVLETQDLLPFAEALFNDRSRDLDGNGSRESGADFITAYIFRMRDYLRQGAVDAMRLVQILRSFDGERSDGYDLNRDGNIEVAGDWNGDGVVDIGGDDVSYFVMGTSLGGLHSSVLAALEPRFIAAAPISAGGGLGDIGARTNLGNVQRGVVLRMMAPIITTNPASRYFSLLTCGAPEDCPSDEACVEGVCRCSRDRDCAGEAGARCFDPPSRLTEGGQVCAIQRDTTCSLSDVSARFLVPTLNNETEVEIACIDEDDLGEGDTLVARNLDNDEVACFAAWPEGRSRLHVPSDTLDRIELTVYDGEVLTDTEHCEVRQDAEVLRVVDTYEMDAVYEQRSWMAGEPLVAPTEGFGLARATPSTRRFMGIAQIALEAADPANMARHYFEDPIDYGDETALTRPMLIGTIGDNAVPISAGIAIARSAGIVDYQQLDPRLADEEHPEGRTAQRFLLDMGVVEGSSRLTPYRRASDGRQVLYDPDDLDRSGSPLGPDWVGDDFGAPAPEVPLRLFRPVVDGETCTCDDESGEHPCSWPGDTVGPLDSVSCPSGVATFVLPYPKIDGEHAVLPDPSQVFDVYSFMGNMIGLYFASEGTTIHWNVCLEDSTCTMEEDGVLTPYLPPLEGTE